MDRVWGGGGCRTSTIYIRERIVNVWQGWGECSARGCPSSLAFFFPSVRSPTTVSVNCVNHCNKVAFGFRQDNMTTMWPFWTGPPLTLTPGFKQSTAGHNACVCVCVRACAREREREREREIKKQTDVDVSEESGWILSKYHYERITYSRTVTTLTLVLLLM